MFLLSKQVQLSEVKFKDTWENFEKCLKMYLILMKYN